MAHYLLLNYLEHFSYLGRIQDSALRISLSVLECCRAGKRSASRLPEWSDTNFYGLRVTYR